MFARRKAFILLFVMAIGLMGGAPLTTAATSNGMDSCGMKCCKKMEKSKTKDHKTSKNFCTMTACNESVPSVPGSASANSIVPAFVETIVTPVVQTSAYSEFQQPPPKSRAGKPDLVNPPPLFVLHHSFLI